MHPAGVVLPDGEKAGGNLHHSLLSFVPTAERQAFARQMDLVARISKPVPVDHAPEMLPGERYSGITFDDAFENVLINAVPELIQRKIPAAIFVTTEVLGKFAGWWPSAAPERHEKSCDRKATFSISH